MIPSKPGSIIPIAIAKAEEDRLFGEAIAGRRELNPVNPLGNRSTVGPTVGDPAWLCQQLAIENGQL